MKKKINMFEASKEMSARVAEFMKVRVYGATIQTRYKRDMGAIDEKIAKTPELLKGSIFEEKTDEIIAELEAQRAEIADKYNELREKADKFVFTQADNDFYKEYKSGNVVAGLIAWGKVYNLTIDGTDFMQTLCDAISGVKNANAKTIITSGATKFTAIRNKGDILKVLYGTMAEKMLAVGTLKPEQLEDDVVEYYKKKTAK